MKYLSVCSGIEAATVAWHHMGWKPVGFSEIEAFPSKVLAHHYPDVQNYGDMTKFKEWKLNDTVELLVGGTPCQSFSVAGLRKGLEDPRGNLMLTYLSMANHFKPKWLLWENVPGVLSSNRGLDFSALLQGLAECGYGFAYRVLDAQYFGVPQRRRRVFVVGCLGDWRSAAKVLFESESLCRDITPRRGEGQEVTGTLTRGFGDRGYDLDQIAGGGCKIEYPQQSVGALDTECGFQKASHQSINAGHILAFREADLHNYKQTEVAGTTKASGGVLGGGSETFAIVENIIGRQPHNGGNGEGITKDLMYTLNATGVHGVAFDAYNNSVTGGVTKTLDTGADYHHVPNLFQDMRVRRLTPMECERLQGFPDNYTNIPGAADTGRYKALGNSMAVPVMRWIGERINEVENGRKTD